MIELGGRLIAVEVKATGAPTPSDVRHLRAFRAEYGDAVAGALLLCTGDEVYRMEEGVVVAPWWRVV